MGILKQSNEYWMEFALKEAEKAFKKGEIPIGAVIIHNNSVDGIRAFGEQGDNIKLTLNKSKQSGTQWEFSSVGDLNIYQINTNNALICIKDGKLGFSGETSSGNIRLEFEATKAGFKSPRLKYSQVVDGKNVKRELGFDLNFKKIVIEKKNG